jgi:hypothetical protein
MSRTETELGDMSCDGRREVTLSSLMSLAAGLMTSTQLVLAKCTKIPVPSACIKTKFRLCLKASRYEDILGRKGEVHTFLASSEDGGDTFMVDVLYFRPHNLYVSPDVIRVIRARMGWVGELTNGYRIFVGKPEGKRPLERPMSR